MVPDVPIAACLLIFYIAGAAWNMTILQVNNRRGHKFIISGATFGFNMARITALVLRIVWANYPNNVKISIASSVMTNAGVVIFFVINGILSWRILRAYHPVFGWSKPVRLAYTFFFSSIIACLFMLIPVIVWSSFTLDMGLQSRLRIVRLVASTYMAVLTFVPIPIVLATVLTHPRGGDIDKFGKRGSMRTNIMLVLFTALLLSIGAIFRACVGYTRRPLEDPGWFNSKAAFYCFNFVIEIIVVWTYSLMRFDQRFWVPNGCNGAGQYSTGGPATEDNDSEVATSEKTTDAEDQSQIA